MQVIIALSYSYGLKGRVELESGMLQRFKSTAQHDGLRQQGFRDCCSPRPVKKSSLVNFLKHRQNQKTFDTKITSLCDNCNGQVKAKRQSEKTSPQGSQEDGDQ
jgi:hypothetical protein